MMHIPQPLTGLLLQDAASTSESPAAPSSVENFFDGAGRQANQLIELLAVPLQQYLHVPPAIAVLLGKLIVFCAILIVARILGGFASGLAGRGLRRSKLHVSKLFDDFARTTTRNVVVLLGVLVALQTIGFSVGPLIAGLGVAGFVIGFALQDTLGNFAAGVMVLLYRPFDVGDWVEAAGVAGTVESMTLVSTTLATADNQRIIIPNGKVWGDVINNVTANPNRRIDLVIGVGYDDDIDRVKQVLTEILTSHDKVLEEPALNVRLHELGDSSVNFIVRPWVKSADYWSTRWDLLEEIKRRFDREGITIPYPQRDVHLRVPESIDLQVADSEAAQ